MTGTSRLSGKHSDHCSLCSKSVEDECALHMEKRWHIPCVKCSSCSRELGRKLEDARYNAFDKRIYCNNCVGVTSEGTQPFEHVTRLQQYTFLLKVALARLMDILKSSGALPGSDDEFSPNGNPGVGGEGPQVRLGDKDQPPYLNSDARSKSYAGEAPQHHRESSY